MTSLKSHAIREFHANTGAADFHAEEIRTIGYTVLGSGLDDGQLQAIRDKIDGIYRRQVDEIGGEANLRRINDANMARCLLGYDDSFAALAAHPAMVEVLTRLLGDYYVLMSQNGVINNPADDHYQVTWHRDLNYQHFVSSRPLAVSALYCVDEFSEETGATYVLPASHKNEQFPSDEYVLRHQTSMNAPAGSILMFDAMVFHRAGTNRSGRLRRAVNHIFTLPLVRQQISLPKMLGGKFSDDPFLRKCFGYGIETGESVQQWRKLKLAAALESAATRK
jgi:ectoine hydroxylase-related dioxygenase (phytanoyl-CoA dioxygenase family)